MARTYDDIYFTNCNGSLHLHLDDPSGTNESVTNAAYFGIEIIGGDVVYQGGYSGNGCEKWVTQFTYEYSDHVQLSDSSNLDLVMDFNDSNAILHIYYETTGDSGNTAATGGHSECFENNWWKDGLRAGNNAAGLTGMKIRLNYRNSGGTVVTQQIIGTNQTSNRVTGQAYIYNAPDGTSGRALIDDDNTIRSGTPYGVTSTPLQSMATTSGCTGDPHVTTFGGCKYTL